MSPGARVASPAPSDDGWLELATLELEPPASASIIMDPLRADFAICTERIYLLSVLPASRKDESSIQEASLLPSDASGSVILLGACPNYGTLLPVCCIT